MWGIGEVRVSAEDYEPLKAFFAVMSDLLFSHADALPPEQRPRAALEATEARSMANARQGLGAAIGDIVEASDDFSPAQLAEIDARLAAVGLLTLSNVRARFGRVVRAIMKRGAVRDERDYYALRSAAEIMSGADKAEAWRLLGDFELRIREKDE
jgi:hypothetical protein